MVEIPAVCPECGWVGGSSVNLAGSGSVKMVDCVTICPNGHPATVPSGTYKLENNVLKFAANAPKDLVALQRIRNFLINVINQDITNYRELINAANQLGEPEILVAKAAPKRDVVDYLVIVLAIISMILSAPNGTESWGEILDGFFPNHEEHNRSKE